MFVLFSVPTLCLFQCLLRVFFCIVFSLDSLIQYFLQLKYYSPLVLRTGTTPCQQYSACQKTFDSSLTIDLFKTLDPFFD